MEIKDPKAAAIVATALRVFFLLGPMMGAQSLTDDQAKKIEKLANAVHVEATEFVTAVVSPLMALPTDAISDDEFVEMGEWGWLLGVLSHVESHANSSREVYERGYRDRIASLN